LAPGSGLCTARAGGLRTRRRVSKSSARNFWSESMEIFDYDNVLLLPRKCRVDSRSE
jgi:hypothetical protein